MNVTFLKNFSEAYSIDRNFKVSEEDILAELLALNEELKQFEPEVYSSLSQQSYLKQQDLLKRYLDIHFEIKDETVIEEGFDFGLGLGSIVMGALLYFNRKWLAKNSFKLMHEVGRGGEWLAKLLEKGSRYMKFSYAVIQKNAEACYKECGIERPNRDLSSLSYFLVGKIKVLPIATEKAIHQANCLRECYVSSLIQAVALYIESYFACLKKTGDWQTISSWDADELMKEIAQTRLSSSCQEYYSEAKKVFENFYDILDFLYTRNEQYIKQRKIDDLRQALYKAKKTVHNTKQLNKYQK